MQKSQIAQSLAIPYGSLPIEAGECVVFTGSNGTFHRSFDAAYAATDRAAYVYVSRLFRSAKWVRFPYRQIKSVRLEPAITSSARLVAQIAVVGLICVSVGASSSSLAVHVFAVASFGYAASLSIKSIRGRSTLVFALGESERSFTSPCDGYEDEKVYDCQLFINFLNAMKDQGVESEIIKTDA